MSHFRQRKFRPANSISNRERMRRADQAIDLGNRATLILLAVLAQSGGEVTVTQGTLNQVGTKLDDLDYVIVPGKTPGESIVRLTEGKSADTEEKAIDGGTDIQHGTDDTEAAGELDDLRNPDPERTAVDSVGEHG